MTTSELRVIGLATEPRNQRKSNEELARMAGVSVSTVSRALRKGVENGLIHIDRLTPGPGDPARIIRRLSDRLEEMYA